MIEHLRIDTYCYRLNQFPQEDELLISRGVTNRLYVFTVIKFTDSSRHIRKTTYVLERSLTFRNILNISWRGLGHSEGKKKNYEHF